jgi:toxin ParE1/3/4
MRVAYTAEALGDVAQVLAFVADQSPTYAPDVAARIDMAGKALGVFPRAARLDRETDTYERPIRGLPLLLIYTVSEELVEVIAVFHTARDLAAKRRRAH